VSTKNIKNYEYLLDHTSSNSSLYVNEFQAEYRTTTKGPLALLIQLTRLIRTKSFPLNPDDFLTENKVIITIFDRVKTALDLAADAGLNGRIEVWDIQQFLSTNISECSLFDSAMRNTKLAEIIEKYNAIIADVETDPSLRIEFEAK